jgi:hypothetical protein
MEPSIQIPTDNIYKFVCLLGLAVFITSVLGSVYVMGNYTIYSANVFLNL